MDSNKSRVVGRTIWGPFQESLTQLGTSGRQQSQIQAKFRQILTFQIEDIARVSPTLINKQTKPPTKEASAQSSVDSKKSATTDAQTRHPTQRPAAHWGEAGLASHIGPPYQLDEAHHSSQMVRPHILAHHTSQMRPTAWPPCLPDTKHWMK